jgi:hypothetical protein
VVFHQAGEIRNLIEKAIVKIFLKITWWCFMGSNSFRSLFITFSLIICLTGQVSQASTFQSKETRVFEFNFQDGRQGWKAGFADSTPNLDTQEKVVFKRKKLPANLATNRKTLFIGGTNSTDDLFMFIKRRLKGLKPNTTYSLQFNIQIATNAPSGCAGVGGAPGESVFFKVGGAQIEPTVDPNTRLLNIDKGNQSQGGRDMFVLGNIANSSIDCLNPPYEFKNFDSQSTQFEVTTDNQGSLWIITGTDSAFESRTELYYSKIVVTLVEK